MPEVPLQPTQASPEPGSLLSHSEGRRTLEAVVRARGPLAPEAAIALGIEVSAQVRQLREGGHSPLRLDASRMVLRHDGEVVALQLDEVGSATLGEERTDVALVAQVLYYALAGRPPASGSSDSLGNSSSAPPLRALAPWVDLEVAELVHAALAAEASQREPTLGWFEEALAPWTSLSFPLPSDALEAASQELSRGSTVSSAHASWATTAAGEVAGPAPAGRTIADGKYRLVRRLGAGGMGAVFEAVRGDGMRVAVKVIDTREGGLSPTAARRLVREARAAASIVHDHVVRVIETGGDDGRGRPWLAMELMNGSNLGAATRNGPIAHPVAARIFLQVLAGVGAAHGRGIIHRDIKPSNVLLHESDDGTVCVKVGDFGLAKETMTSGTDATTIDLTRSEGLLGSPRYMSPEQAKSAKRIDQRSDLWSVAVSLFEALTGHRPFESCTTIGEIIVAICTEQLPDPRRYVPTLPAGLVDALRRGYARDPADRFASAQEFADALAPFAAPAAELTRAALRAGRASIPDATPTPTPTPAVEAASASTSVASGASPTMGGVSTPPPVPAEPTRSRRPFAIAVAAAAAAVVFGAMWIRGGDGASMGAGQPTTTAATPDARREEVPAAPSSLEDAPRRAELEPAAPPVAVSPSMPPVPAPVRPRGEPRTAPPPATAAVAPPPTAAPKAAPSMSPSPSASPAPSTSADRGLPPPIDNW